jgi:SAM-dependent methyltransferase
MCHGDLAVDVTREAHGEVETGLLSCHGCHQNYPIVRFIPRFTPQGNYADSFGLQWLRFRKTQLDSHTGVPISRDRFFRQSGWGPATLQDKVVLDVGCGAGRFSEVALSCGASVVALDFSNAVDACWSNLGPNPSLNVVQGDLYALPFKDSSFDFVYCFGVLQHTPDVRRSFLSLVAPLRPSGEIAVDVYVRRWFEPFLPKYILRLISTRLDQKLLFRIVQAATPALLFVSNLIGRLPIVGGKLRKLVPVANYRGVYPLSSSQLLEFATLDTFDMLSPVYDKPQRASALSRWFLEAGLTQVEVFRSGHLVGRGVKPPTDSS